MQCLHWEGQARGDKIGKSWHRSSQQCQDFLQMLCETFAETQDQCMSILMFELHNKLKSRPDAKSGQLFLMQEGTTVLLMAKMASLMLEHFLVVPKVACRGGVNLVQCSVPR